MPFNFEAAGNYALKSLDSNLLELILLGPSGAGKSYAASTLKDYKTLYLYCSGENHGPKTAIAHSDGDILPVCLDVDDDGVRLSPDQVRERLFTILGDHKGIQGQGFEVVFLDGIPELEQIFLQTTYFENYIKTDKGKINHFQKSAAMNTMLKQVIDELKDLQRNVGIHFVCTCLLTVREFALDGSVKDSAPSLLSYSVADMIVRQFGDILVVGEMFKLEQGKKKVAHRFQMGAKVTKSQTDEDGDIRKSYNYSPRIVGYETGELPASIPADLGAVIGLKKEKRIIQ